MTTKTQDRLDLIKKIHKQLAKPASDGYVQLPFIYRIRSFKLVRILIMRNVAIAILQILWIPIGIVGISFGYISDYIESSHLKICDFVQILRNNS